VHNTHPSQIRLYERAQLFQHILLRRDGDVISDYIPAEIGGDGSYPSSSSFLERVIETKSRDKFETYYRISELMRHRLGMKLVRSDTLNQVVTKFGAWMPAVNKFKTLLPPEIVVEIDESNSSLRSLGVRGFLEPPTTTLFRLVKTAYYTEIFKGVPVDELPVLAAEKPVLSTGKSSVPYTNLQRFISHWGNPGFSWRNEDPYLVRADLAPRFDYMNLGLEFNPKPLSVQDTLVKWLELNTGSILDEIAEDIFQNLLRRTDLPYVLKERLNLCVESDSIIKESFTRSLPAQKNLVLVSRDRRLAADLVRLGEARGREYQVYLFPPAFYLFGRLDELDVQDYEVIEDSGAMAFEDMVYFSEGEPPEWIFDEIQTKQTRYHGVLSVDRIKP